MNTKRRDALKALFETGPAMEPDEAMTPAPEQKGMGPRGPIPRGTVPRQSSGAVKAMGLALGGLTEEVAAARELKQELERSGRIVELDPAAIDKALVSDRLSREETGDEAFAGLVESIRQSGQQVPVLVRPHPDKEGRYQTAYGYRRIRACARLERPVRAVIRALTDDELIMAQGKENSERRNLSFIERAMFAHALVGRGFKRKVVEEALSLHKAEMARLMQVADAMPTGMAKYIGPAPKIGRPRWLSFAKHIRSQMSREVAFQTANSDAFKRASSDERFEMIYRHIARRPASRPAPQELNRQNGEAVARIATTGTKPRIDFIGSEGAAFAAFVAAELPGLLERFEDGRGR